MIKIIIFLILVYTSYYDIKHKIIRDRVILALLIIGIFKNFHDYESIIIGMGVYPLPFIILYSLEDIIKKEIIGFGDIKLMLSLGAILGYSGLYNVLLFYQILYILAGIFAVIYLIIKKNKNMYIPFAPFICITFYLQYLFIDRGFI